MTYLAEAIQLRETGRLDEARTALLVLIENDPMNPSIWYQCAWVHDSLGRESEAVPYYTIALELGLLGEERRAMEIVLKQLLETSNDAGIHSYGKAISFYSDKLDEIWK